MTEDLESGRLLGSAHSPSPSDGPVVATPLMMESENGPLLWGVVLAQMPPGAIIAGGAVRDFFLGVEPKDIDVFLPVEAWPASGLGHAGFERLGADRDAEYAAMPSIAVVQRGKISGRQVDVVGVWFDDADYTPARIVSTFDFGISRCWFDGEIHDTPEAKADRDASTVTLMLNDRPDRAAARFDRFNTRMGGNYTLVTPPYEGVAVSAREGASALRPQADQTPKVNP